MSKGMTTFRIDCIHTSQMRAGGNVAAVVSDRVWARAEDKYDRSPGMKICRTLIVVVIEPTHKLADCMSASHVGRGETRKEHTCTVTTVVTQRMFRNLSIAVSMHKLNQTQLSRRKKAKKKPYMQHCFATSYQQITRWAHGSKETGNHRVERFRV